jgi:glutamate-ammonia-ligase adenylyltransferase
LAAVAAATYSRPWQVSDAAEIRAMRFKLQESASPRNLKRGPGGTMDTEFVVQMLQLKHGDEMPELRVPGTLEGLSVLEQAGILSVEDAAFLWKAYQFQRSIEARIRLMNASGRHEFPDDPVELSKLAFLLGYPFVDALCEEVTQTFHDVRATFLRIFDAAERV